MRFKSVIIVSSVLIGLVACDSKERVKAPEQGHQMAAPQESTQSNHVIHVEEVIDANSYTYLRVTEGSEEYWIATAKQPIEVGMTLNFDGGLEMKEFVSKELNKTFDSIWFVGQMKGASNTMVKSSDAASPYSGEKNAVDSGISIDKLAGGVSVQDLFASPSSYDGKMVSIRGKVTKFNSNIMGLNWVHLQDGSQSGENYDLTITTKEVVAVGDVVVFTGKVTLNKDFGAGYKYNVILEEALLAQEG